MTEKCLRIANTHRKQLQVIYTRVIQASKDRYCSHSSEFTLLSIRVNIESVKRVLFFRIHDTYVKRAFCAKNITTLK